MHQALRRLDRDELARLRPLDEQAYLEELLEIGNRVIGNRPSGGRVMEAYARLQTGVRNIHELGPLQLKVDLRHASQDVREQLTAFVDDWRKASRDLLAVQRVRAGGVMKLPIVVDNTVADLVLARDVRAGIDHAFCLLCDDSRPWGRMLCRCQLSTCEKFFFEYKQKTGRPRRVYCSDKCMKCANDTDAAERAARWRQEKKDAKKARKPK